MPLLDSNKCVKCGSCVEVCPGGVFEQKEPRDAPEVVRRHLCIECGHCTMICPVDAVSVPGYSADKTVALRNLPEIEQVTSLLLGRRSIRSFSDKQVDHATLEKIVVLAASAPSAHNVQSTEFTVVQNFEALELVEQYTVEGLRRMVKAVRNPITRPLAMRMLGKRYREAVKLLPYADFVIESRTGGKHLILHGAPALIAFHGKPKLMADFNAQLCIQNALIAISGFGLGGFYSAFVTALTLRDKRLQDLLKVPKGNELFGVVALGYPRTKFTKYAQRKTPKITWK